MHMEINTQFRISKDFQLKDENASLRPLADKPESKTDSKSGDKLSTISFAEKIANYQEILYAQKKHKLLIVLQGMDTSGKDGTVRGVFGQINPLGARTVAFKAPSTVEREHDYLWRIHQEVPVTGEIVIFNRSHYEDVLITRVHEWITEAECKRRFAQIRDFERMLTETGTVMLKFFLHISKAEQKQRLEERLADPDKHWKFDPQDLVEREYWDRYQQAYTDAIKASDADHAPWYIIPSNSKTQRNLAIAQIVVEKLESMKLAFPPGNPEYSKIKVS
ncbi:MAG: polyphosphate kinase 2 family protein [Undibacterium sp.]|nr:PPK2 family polyphosphate kinase [Undibacterium sp.]MDO8654031.1 polyphosphate kinase 2 family protein [Undibacterium sp.]